MEVTVPCAESILGIPTGKARWKYDPAYGPAGGWVLQGCNCLGRFCKSPSGKGEDDEVRDTDCVDSPMPGSP
jgi:hypothetical protein